MQSTLAQLAPQLAGARVHGQAAFAGVTTDSRTAGPGMLFVALRGEHFDGHHFIEQVGQKGVAAVVVEQLPAGCTLPAIVVPDTLQALGQIGKAWRRQHPIPLIGVCGSNGKTTVKEMIAAILAAAFGAEGRLATSGNLNNEIGVPLTVLRLAPHHRAAVVELGMNHPGEIARLSAIAEPTIGLVNNAQREHQEFMHTVEAVAIENGAVIAALPADGVAVFPGDEDFTPLWRNLATSRGQRRVITFGFDMHSNVSGAWVPQDFGSTLHIEIKGVGAPRQLRVQLAAAGLHNARNAMAATACALAAGISDEAIVRGLEAFAPVSGRLQRKQAACGATIIDDTYNANPDSVRAAIDVLAQANAPRILVLGDMGEVGEQGPQFHEEIAAYAQGKGIETVLCTGELARHMAGHGARHYPQFDDLLAALDSQLGSKSDATVLVKGSRFMKMERVVQHLLDSPTLGKDAH
ncbi:UDP-N-acetylmuramoyl-tripeptide--D-alanyl-D-alanine ligase [Massilia sp. TS11]|uniref:UDP-N-acetylmuramoyl-tripeptide--D-alanyl-D- alanine ligase n=1 Tax=Massilia sp. TS11 TaxID=2908003 RepID=UPI001EDB09BD|nr:UDP-N-acetylmuramoyl-tripeptide--D-alanyl-D-alanine ligase [Massilia sp. TS11]MCG2585326.1 UDP-N-acetylmuramoyl-tripeptide--D-alanyl-D-alanine ligase [Massilia sp. TS11]